LFYDQEDEMST